MVEGQGRVLIEDAWHDVGPGSVVFVPADVLHTYENTGDDAVPLPLRHPHLASHASQAQRVAEGPTQRTEQYDAIGPNP